MTELKSELNSDAEHHRKLADGFLVQGKLAEAIAACQAAIALQSDFTAAYITLGKAQLGQGRLDDATAAYTQAIALQPDCGEAYADLGTIALQSGQINEAMSLYRQAAELQPDLAIAHWMLANLLKEQGNLNEAFARQQQALALQPNLASASEHNSMGSVLVMQGKLEEAILFFHRAIQMKPNYAMAYLNLGSAFAQQGKQEEAIASFQRAIEIEPTNAGAYVSLGNALGGLNKLDAAIAAFQRAIELKPDYTEAYIRLAIVFGCQDKLNEVIACSLHALLIEPNNAEIYLNLGTASLRKNKLEEAIAYYQKATQIRPEYSDAYVGLSDANLGLGRIEAAIVNCRKVLEMNPNHPVAYFVLANAMVKQENHEEAVTYLQKAIELQPDYTDAYWRLVIAWNALKNYKKARQVAEQYHQLFEQKDPIRSTVAFITTYVSSGLKQEPVTSMFLDLESQVYTKMDKLRNADVEVLYNNLLFNIYDLRDSPSENSKLSKLIGNTYREKIIKSKQEPLAFAGLKHRMQKESLRIGFLSPHFGRHSVGWCSGDAIRELSHLTPHLYLYATGKLKRDDRTQMLEQVVRKFYHPTGQAIRSADIVEQVLQDEIDVLVDLDSLTCSIHGEILYRQPSPVCISWLGFDAPFLSQKNYFLGDWHTHPPGSEQYYIERIVRLPNSHMAVRGFERPTVDRDTFRNSCGISAEQVAYLSAAPSRKFTAHAARAQVRILKCVSNSILLRKGFGDMEVIQAAYQMECDLQGVNFSRIKFLPLSLREEEHRTVYELADVSLDSYPYNGGTHNLEALWFNTPLVTRVGEQSFARMGYSFLQTLGIEAGIAWSWEEYTEWGIRFGLDADLRNSVRAQLVKSKQPDNLSPLWNPKHLARDMYAIFEELLLKPGVNNNI